MLTRSKPKKRYSRVKIVLLFILFMVLLFTTLSVWYVNEVRANEEQMEKAAIQRSSEQVAWSDIIKVEKSIWDSVYYVVTGKDETGAVQMAWVNEGSVTVKAAADGVTRSDVAQSIKEQYPAAQISHIIPSVKNDEYVWEALVKREDEAGITRNFYHFYTFSTGSPTGDIFAMPNQ